MSKQLDVDAVLRRLAPERGELSESIRVRLDPESRDGLDRIEAVLRGQGHRDVNRSRLIRTAIAEFVASVGMEKLP